MKQDKYNIYFGLYCRQHITPMCVSEAEFTQLWLNVHTYYQLPARLRQFF